MRAAAGLAALAVISCSSPSVPPARAPLPEPDVPIAEAPPPVAPEPPAFRIPRDVQPTAQALELTIDPAQPTFTGRVRIDARVIRSTHLVWLHATDLTVTSATVGGQAATVIPGGADFVGLQVATALPEGAVTIDVAYDGAIDRERSRGIYAEAEGDAWYAYTFFEAIDARRAFPCFDEPEFKIPWQLTFHVRADHVALGNTAVVAETPEDGGMKKVELAPSKPLPSYLVAFVVGPFEVIDGGVAGRAQTPVRFVVPAGRAAELRYAKEVTPKVVAALEDYFDMDYPFGKLDVAVVPRYWGTMEHPGIVAMGQPLTLIPPDQETVQRRQHYANILAHELAHYWFGDVVTMTWWDDTWLNEALGSWMDILITDAIEPAWDYADHRLDNLEAGMAADELAVARAMRQPVDSAEGIQAAFDNGITYSKGSAVMRMWESYVGRDDWRGFIRAYIAKFAWGNASADDFLTVLDAELGAQVMTGLLSFLEQPGVPVVTHELTCADGAGKLAIHQRRALPVGSVDPEPRTWRFPVCVSWRVGAKTEQRCQVTDTPDDEIALPVCPAAVMMNAGANGYYRSAYSAAEIHALLGKPGKKAKARSWLTPVERRLVVADLAAAVARDELPVGDALGLVPTLLADPDDTVVLAGLGLAGLVDARVLDDAQYAQAKRFALAAFGPLARKLGWARRNGDSDERQQLRLAVVAVAAGAGDKKLAAEARKLVTRWLKDPASVGDDVIGTALAVSAATGDAALFDTLLAAARDAPDRRAQGRLLGVLGRFRDPMLAQRALDLIRSDEFDLRESRGVLFGVLTTRETSELAWGFLKLVAPDLLPRMREDEVAGMVGGVTSLFCDAAHRDEAVALFSPHIAAYAGAEAELAQAVERVDQCIATQARALPGIRDFLAAY